MGQKRVALVTGAGTGIGKAAALALLEDGYHVALVGRRAELLEKTAAQSGTGERAMVLSQQQGARLVAQAIRHAHAAKRTHNGATSSGT